MKSANATTVLAKIEQRRAVDEVYERLREAILTKQFSPGSGSIQRPSRNSSA
jgi:DNA-binding GntR family transcriptional regulator